LIRLFQFRILILFKKNISKQSERNSDTRSISSSKSSDGAILQPNAVTASDPSSAALLSFEHVSTNDTTNSFNAEVDSLISRMDALQTSPLAAACRSTQGSATSNKPVAQLDESGHPQDCEQGVTSDFNESSTDDQINCVASNEQQHSEQDHAVEPLVVDDLPPLEANPVVLSTIDGQGPNAHEARVDASEGTEANSNDEGDQAATSTEDPLAQRAASESACANADTAAEMSHPPGQSTSDYNRIQPDQNTQDSNIESTTATESSEVQHMVPKEILEFTTLANPYFPR
jgi:hypothetical protein